LNKRLLVVEDDASLAEVLCDNLEIDGFEVRRAADIRSAINLLIDFVPDLIILDVTLPDRSGFDAFDTLHQGGRTSIIFLTARGTTADKVRGFRLGADDYVTKPFDLEELLARVRAVLKRIRTDASGISLGEITIDFQSRIATKAGQLLHLTHREFEILRYLAARQGQVVYRSELLRAVWGYPDNSAYTLAVDHAIARIRKKIEVEPDQPWFIHTAHGDGYSLTMGDPGVQLKRTR
jgi:DNA-binding response OmpR family regulator